MSACCNTSTLQLVIADVLFTVSLILVLLIILNTETVDGISVTATAPAVDGFGWTTFGAMAQKRVSRSVDTARGAGTTADTTKTPLSRATPVL